MKFGLCVVLRVFLPFDCARRFLICGLDSSACLIMILF